MGYEYYFTFSDDGLVTQWSDKHYTNARAAKAAAIRLYKKELSGDVKFNVWQKSTDIHDLRDHLRTSFYMMP